MRIEIYLKFLQHLIQPLNRISIFKPLIKAYLKPYLKAYFKAYLLIGYMPVTTARPEALKQKATLPETPSLTSPTTPISNRVPSVKQTISPGISDVKVAPRFPRVRQQQTSIPSPPSSLGFNLAISNTPSGLLGRELSQIASPYLAGLLVGDTPNNNALITNPDLLTRGSFEAGLRDRQVIKNLSKPPQFNIPQVRIPEVKLPQIPKIELPKLPQLPKVELPKLPGLPEIKIPQIPKLPQFPKLPSLKPTPQPKPQPLPPKPPGKTRFKLPASCNECDMSITFGFREDYINNQPILSSLKSIWDMYPITIDNTFDINTSLFDGDKEGIKELRYLIGGVYDPNTGVTSGGTQIIGYRKNYIFSKKQYDKGYLDLDMPMRIRNGKRLDTPWEILRIGCNGCQKKEIPPTPEQLPPQPPKKDKECCMCNCEQTEEMMRLILKRIGTLPAQIPNKLTDRNAGRRTVNSLSEFMAQQIRLLDDLMGYFPLEIEIEDSDLTEEGNQKQEIKVPNLAEALRELIGLVLVLKTESSANLSATLRTLIEAGSAKQAAILAHDYGEATADFLGYEIKQVEKNVPFAFTPGKQKIEEMLQEAIVKVKSVENVDTQTFQKEIFPLLEMASRWNAQNWRNLGKGNGGEALKNLLNLGLNIATNADQFIGEKKKENPNDIPKSDFDNFLEEVENGFNTQDGIQKPENPYGYPYDERPKIRQLGNTFEEEDK